MSRCQKNLDPIQPIIIKKSKCLSFKKMSDNKNVVYKMLHLRNEPQFLEGFQVAKFTKLRCPKLGVYK